MSVDYRKILDYLREYGGQQYKRQEKCRDAVEEKYMQEGAEKGREARQIFTDIANSIEEKKDLVVGKITQWQNSGTFVSYFWTQLKRQKYEDSNISISLFAEKADPEYRIRLSVELAVEKSSDKERQQYRRLLDMPLDDGLVYVSGGNNDGKFEVLSERDNQIIKSSGYKKIQVSYIVSNNISNQEFEEILEKKVENLLKYYDYVFSDEGTLIPREEEWLPGENEYSPGLTKAQWLDLLSDDDVFKNQNLLAMACIYDNGGEGSCTELGEKYNQSMTLWRTSCGVHLAERIANKTGCLRLEENGKTTFFVIPFLYRKTSSGEMGSYIYKLRPELYDALTEYDILRFLPEKEGEDKLDIKDTIEQIKAYIASNGFSYNDDLIENFYLSLKSKPFVILAGTSGTGKTRLVKLFAEAIGATEENNRYKLVSVRPDWSDSSDLFGHVNLQNEFVDGEITEFINEAIEHKNVPFFLCLDEMNLARVEYYLSDYLSIIESRKRDDDEIRTNIILKSSSTKEKYPDLYLPENLYVIGTVNMDETTFPFSKKVLDRANTIEFSYVDLVPEFSEIEEQEALELGNEFLKTEYVVLKKDIEDIDQEYVKKVSEKLQEINEILVDANAHVGYRVRDEIVFYMLNNKKASLLSDEEAFDNEIMQKILPRIQGGGKATQDLLLRLFKKFAGNESGISEEKSWKEMKEYIKPEKDEDGHIKKSKCTYPKSAEKICYMMRRLEEDGFTSYWL